MCITLQVYYDQTSIEGQADDPGAVPGSHHFGVASELGASDGRVWGRFSSSLPIMFTGGTGSSYK